MNTSIRILARAAGFSAAFLIGASPAFADGAFRNRDNKSQYDISEGTYPIPYQMPTKAEVVEVLNRVRGFLEIAAPTVVVDKRTGAQITDKAGEPVEFAASKSDYSTFSAFDYTMGVTHAGMLQCAEVTGDGKFRDFTERHMNFIADWRPYFGRQRAQFKGVKEKGFEKTFAPDSLDSCGAMCAALIKSRRAGVGPDLMPVIGIWSDYIKSKQFRLTDGTLARKRPQAVSVWADDYYMSIPALAQMGKLTGDRSWYDDGARQVVQMAGLLFDEKTGLFAHGWNAGQPDNPEYYWGRANGWAMMATVELLDVLPEDHPRRAEILGILRKHIRAVVKLQSGDGLWHQMLDKYDTYTESSCSAMFVYGIFKAINRGWISPISYGSAAQAGWIGLTQRVNRLGQIEGTCVGTTFASDHVYYYNRPVSVYASHSYGALLLAGSEFLKAMDNPAFKIQRKVRTYHYIPEAAK